MSIPSADPNLSPAQAQSDVQAQEDLTKRIELKNKLCHRLVSSVSQVMKSDVGGSSLVGIILTTQITVLQVRIWNGRRTIAWLSARRFSNR